MSSPSSKFTEAAGAERSEEVGAVGAELREPSEEVEAGAAIGAIHARMKAVFAKGEARETREHSSELVAKEIARLRDAAKQAHKADPLDDRACGVFLALLWMGVAYDSICAEGAEGAGTRLVSIGPSVKPAPSVLPAPSLALLRATYERLEGRRLFYASLMESEERAGRQGALRRALTPLECLGALAAHFEGLSEKSEAAKKPEKPEEEGDDDDEEEEGDDDDEEEEEETDEEEQKETEAAVASWHARLVGAGKRLERLLSPEDAQELERDGVYERASEMYASRDFVRRALEALCADARAVYKKNPDRAKGESTNWGRWYALDRLRVAYNNGRVPPGDETRFVALVVKPGSYVPFLQPSRWLVREAYLYLGQVGRELQAAAVRALSMYMESSAEALVAASEGREGREGREGPRAKRNSEEADAGGSGGPEGGPRAKRRVI